MLPRSVAHVIVSVVFLVLAGSCDDGSERAGAGERCGAWGAGPCGRGLYCQYPDGACAEVDGVGTCKVEPSRCDGDEPVCGCDGERYESVCAAIAAGVDDIVTGNTCGLDDGAAGAGGPVDPRDPA